MPRFINFKLESESELAKVKDLAQVLILRLYHSQPNLSYADAALELNIPVGTVKSRLHRGRARVIKNRRVEAAHDELRGTTEAV